MSLSFQLVSASGLKYDGEAYEVLVPTLQGEIAIFENHMPLLSAGAPGVLSVRKKASDSDAQKERFAVFGGVLQVNGKSARFITEDVTTSEEVVEQEALEAVERARKLVAGASTREALDEAKMVQSHHEVRLHLAKLKRRHHQ